MIPKKNWLRGKYKVFVKETWFLNISQYWFSLIIAWKGNALSKSLSGNFHFSLNPHKSTPSIQAESKIMSEKAHISAKQSHIYLCGILMCFHLWNSFSIYIVFPLSLISTHWGNQGRGREIGSSLLKTPAGVHTYPTRSIGAPWCTVGELL